MNRNEIEGGNLIRWINLDDFYGAEKISEGIVIRHFCISLNMAKFDCEVLKTDFERGGDEPQRKRGRGKSKIEW